MKKNLLYSLLVLITTVIAQTQTVDHAWLQTHQLKVRINADGRLFCDDEKGAFLVQKGDSTFSLMRGVGLWFGGIDPGNNLQLSAQEPQQSDFVAGFRGIPNSGRVWKVTRDDIIAHLQDYYDNWVVDHPIPSIFGWPAKGNPYFFQYNGFKLPDSMAKFSFSENDNWNWNYEPNQGEIPLLYVNALDGEWLIPSEMACFAFYSDAPGLLSGSTRPYPVQVWGQAFVYDCPENDLLMRSVFVQYSWLNENEENIDSARVSILTDIDLGDPEDDYQGFLPGRSAHFAYNADDTDSIWGGQVPLVMADVVMPPWATRYNSFFNEYEEFWSTPGFMPYGPPNYGGGMGAATTPNQFYNYQTGSWRDNVPLTVGGRGYNPGNPGAVQTSIAFPGYPDSVGLWTELNAHNLPGNRRALTNFNIGTTFPKSINRMLIQYTYLPWQEGSLTQRIQQWEADQEYLWDRLYCCIDFHVPLPPIGCEYVGRYATKPPIYTVFPNPANDVLKVWHPNNHLKKMWLFDALGRKVGEGEYRDQYSEISVQNLPPGIYFLRTETSGGEEKVVKVVVAHGQE